MKMSTLSSLFVLLSVVSMIAIAPIAFADHTEVTIDAIAGSGADMDCDATDICWTTGRAVSIAVGGEVTFVNTDNVPHSLSSGTPGADNENPAWPVVLVMQPIDGNVQSQSFTLDSAGEYPFFCMVHAWMIGTITVEDEAAAEAETAADAAEAEAAAAAEAAEAAAAAAAAAAEAAEAAAAAATAEAYISIATSTTISASATTRT